MKNDSYVLKLVKLEEEEHVLRNALDKPNLDRQQKDYLFKQLDSLCEKKKTLQFKINLKRKCEINEKSR